MEPFGAATVRADEIAASHQDNQFQTTDDANSGERDQLAKQIKETDDQARAEVVVSWSSGESSGGEVELGTMPNDRPGSAIALGGKFGALQSHSNHYSGKTNSNSISQSAKAKLRTATHALLFFRSHRTRPDSPATTASARNVDNSSPRNKLSRWAIRGRRQDTTDSLPGSPPLSKRANNRGESDNNPLTHSQSQYCSMSSSSGAFSDNNSSNNNNSNVTKNHLADRPQVSRSTSVIQSTSAAANEVPQFIVPKMNALRLPIVCRIRSLEGELMREVFVHRYELGQYLVESLKVAVGIKDSMYFGLKLARSVDEQEDLRQPWLDLNESVCKQLKQFGYAPSTCPKQLARDDYNGLQQQQCPSAGRSVDFYLRVKFYPPNLNRIQDSFLREYLWLQLRRDLRLGKLISSMNNLTLLMACILQHELGDYRPELLNRLPDWNILPNQDLIEEQALIVWRTKLAGSKRHQAQMQFLRAAVILETYGFDYYPVRDHQRQRAYLLGFNYAGIKTIRNGRIVHHFRWHSLSKIAYERRMIIFHIYPTENSKRKQILGFKCLSNHECRSLYMRLLEQKYFFTVDLAYFDKSVRRPSYLHSTLDAHQLHNEDIFSERGGNHGPEWSTTGGGGPTAGQHERLANQASQHSGLSHSCNCADCSSRNYGTPLETGLNQTSNQLQTSSSIQEPLIDVSEFARPNTMADARTEAPGCSNSPSCFQMTTRRGPSQPVLVRQSAASSHSLDPDPPGRPPLQTLAAGARLIDDLHLDTEHLHKGPQEDDEEEGLQRHCTYCAHCAISDAQSVQPSVPSSTDQAGFWQTAKISGQSLSMTVSLWSSFVVERLLHGLIGQRSKTARRAPNSSHERQPDDSVSPAPAGQLLLIILVMNFLLRLSDGLSNVLIEVLTLSTSGSSSTTIASENLF